MWWVALFYFVNAVAPHLTVVYNDKYRIVIAGFPINILDGLLAIGLLLSVLPVWKKIATPIEHPCKVKKWALFCLWTALILGTLESYLFLPGIPSYARIIPIRNFILVPICIFLAYRFFTKPQQAKFLFWTIFLSSLGSAISSIVTSRGTTSELIELGTFSYDALRKSALDVAGDAGLLAVCIILFSLIIKKRLMPYWLTIIFLIISIAGLFFIPHRSAWLIFFLTILYVGWFVWPYDAKRKLNIFAQLLLYSIVILALAITTVQQQTGKDFDGWIQRRILSIIPDESSNQPKAWDTRIPGMLYELSLWIYSPITGRGFSAQAYHAMRGDTEIKMSFNHTPWVSTLCETGLVGEFGFIFAIGGLTLYGLRLARKVHDNQWLGYLGVIGTAWGFWCIVMGWMSMSWNSTRAGITLGLLSGLVFRAYEFSQQSPSYTNLLDSATNNNPTAKDSYQESHS